MAGEAVPPGKQTFVDDTGRPLIGGLIYHYEPGTDTFKDTWQDEGETALNTNPVVLDARGQAAIWGNGLYRQRLTDAAGNAIWDRVTGIAPPPTPPVNPVLIVESVAAAQALDIDAAVNTLCIMGYTTAGDGGQGVWVRTGGAGTYPRSYFQSGDGAYWLYKPDARGVNAMAFGAIPDGAVGVARAFSGTNNAPMIQAAIDYATYACKCVCYIPAGGYLIADALQLSYGVGFRTTVLEGAGGKFRGESVFSGTMLLCNFSDRPGLAVNGQRTCVIRRLGVMGKNFNWIESHNLGGAVATIDDTVVASWIDPALAANANSQHAPYGAIVIDPYAGAQPGTHYPNVTFPAFMGAPGQYNKDFSSRVEINEVYIGGFVVGVMIQPNGDGNGDFIKLQNVQAEMCTYQISGGNTQGRAVGTIDSSLSRMFAGVVNTVHGTQLGQLNLVSTNCDWESCTNILDIGNSAQSGAFTFIGGYSESIWRIGNWGNNSASNNSLTFIGYTFHFSLQTDARGHPGDVLAGADQSPVTFDGCGFFGQKNLVQFLGTAAAYTFRGSTQFQIADRVTAYEKLACNFLASGCMIQPNSGDGRPAQFIAKADVYYDNNTGGSAAPLTIPNLSRSKREFPICAWIHEVRAYEQQRYMVQAPNKVWSAQNKAGLAAVALVGSTLTITFGARTDQQFAYSGPLPGDVVWDDDSKSVFYVRSRIGNVVLAELQNNYKKVGGVVTPLVAFRPAVGNFYFGNSRIYLPEYYLRGDLDTASPIITNCGRDDGYAAWMDGDTQIVPGDYALVDDQLDRWASPTVSLVLAVDGVGKTITLDGNPARTETVHPLGLFVRQPPANV